MSLAFTMIPVWKGHFGSLAISRFLWYMYIYDQILSITWFSLLCVIWLSPWNFKFYLILTLYCCNIFKLLLDRHHKNNNRSQKSRIVLLKRITLLRYWSFLQPFFFFQNSTFWNIICYHLDRPGMPTDRRKVVFNMARILGLPDEHTRQDRFLIT